MSKYWKLIENHSLAKEAEKYVDNLIKFKNYEYIENSFIVLTSRYTQFEHEKLEKYNLDVLLKRIDIDSKLERLSIIHKTVEFRLGFLLSKSKLLAQRINQVNEK